MKCLFTKERFRFRVYRLPREGTLFQMIVHFRSRSIGQHKGGSFPGVSLRIGSLYWGFLLYPETKGFVCSLRLVTLSQQADEAELEMRELQVLRDRQEARSQRPLTQEEQLRAEATVRS